MAANVEADESNGAVEVVTHGITTSYYGAVDQANLAAASTSPIIAGQNSFEKWQRWHVTDLGGSVSVKNLRFYASAAPAASATHNFNGHTTQATYDGANHKQTAFSQPATSATRTPETVPTTEPASANIGIAGSLTGSLTAVGSSDYVLSQIRLAGAALVGATFRLTFQYDETV